MWSKGDLEDLFDSQLRKLRINLVSREILFQLEKERRSVIKKVNSLTLTEEVVPFLPIIPESFFDAISQTRMVKHNGYSGFYHLEPSQVVNTMNTPSKPYYIYRVSDGAEMLSLVPKQAAAIFKGQCRRGLTIIETISLCIHKDVLSRHFVDAISSIYGQDAVPYIIRIQDKVFVESHLYEASIDWSGAASCDL